MSSNVMRYQVRQIFYGGSKDGLERICEDLPDAVEFPQVNSSIQPGTTVVDRLTRFPFARVVALERYQLTGRGTRCYGPIEVECGTYRFLKWIPIEEV